MLLCIVWSRNQAFKFFSCLFDLSVLQLAPPVRLEQLEGFCENPGSYPYCHWISVRKKHIFSLMFAVFYPPGSWSIDNSLADGGSN